MMRSEASNLSLIANVVLVLLAGPFGVACMARPKFGNLSRSMGLIFLGVALMGASAQMGSWRMCALSIGGR
jgi:hypothetical protein